MTDSPGADDVRATVRAWLDERWDPERPLREWRGELADAGWACPTWPREWYGRGLTTDLGRVVADELRAVGAVGPAIGVGMALAAPTLLAHGSDDLKGRLLRPIATGEDRWCQLFSEPGSGSDLAGLTTRAVRDGEQFVVEGQKVWTTGAHQAAYGMLLARTDWDVPKHRGITFFALPMGQPGIEVRPLRQMNGRASFNEVFLSEARVSVANVVGDLHDGWAAALTTLAHERGLAAAIFGGLPPGGGGRTRDEARAEATSYLATYEWYPQRAGRADLVRSRAVTSGVAGHRLTRQTIAHLEATERTARWTAERAAAARRTGRPPGPEGSLGKLAASIIAREAAAAHSTIAGAEGMLTGPDSPEGGIVAEVFVSVPGASIAGGTDEVQHNIIGERVLGLPKEPSVDADVPFRAVNVNHRRSREIS